MMMIDDYMDMRKSRFELVCSAGLWRVHDKQEHTYTWGMTMDEAKHYLQRQGVKVRDVKVVN